MNTPVSSNLAKLLKEKVFDERVKPFYNGLQNNELQTSDIIGTSNQLPDWYPAPTIADVVMWLYEKYSIWVYTRPVLDEDGQWIFKGYVKIMNNFKEKEFQTKMLRLPTEACEDAIKYTLNNLI